MFPAVAFRLKVQAGSVTYLPIEMSGVNGLVAEPGKTARVDLTLGQDSDGDGLPDAWERTMLAALGRQGTIQDIKPDGGRRRGRDQQPEGVLGRDVCV
jgi:hypothetical protein